MTRLRAWIVLSMALGVVALVTGGLAALALQDIYHSEADVSLEWRLVQLSAVSMVAFIISALFVLGRALRGTTRGAAQS